jgi:N6-adenosine-specific RNA methylase IME4
VSGRQLEPTEAMTSLQPIADGASRAVELVAQARAALATARTVPEIRTVKEWVGLAGDAARRAGKLADTQQMREQASRAERDAHALRIRALWLEGQLLRELSETGLRARRGNHRESRTLRDLGDDDDGQDAARAMQVAAIPEGVLDQYLDDPPGQREQASVAGLLRYASDAARPRHGQAPPMPVGCYRTIVVDPPWPITKLDRIAHPNQGSHLDYPTMTLDEIAALPIAERASDGTHLYLWVTQRFVHEGFHLLEGWGFTYHCQLTWTKPGGFAPYSFMFNTEHVLFAYRPPFELARQGLKIGFSAPTTGHSVKPEAFYELVEQASFAPRLELFARLERPGWTAWGDEVPSAEQGQPAPRRPEEAAG